MIALFTPFLLLGAALPAPAQADLTLIGVDPFEPDKTLGPVDAGRRDDDRAVGALDASLFFDGTLLVYPADAAGLGLAVRPKFRDATIEVIRDGARLMVLWRAAGSGDRPPRDDRWAAVVLEGDRMQVFGLAEFKGVGAGQRGGVILCYGDLCATDADPGTGATRREVHRPGMPR